MKYAILSCNELSKEKRRGKKDLNNKIVDAIFIRFKKSCSFIIVDISALSVIVSQWVIKKNRSIRKISSGMLSNYSIFFTHITSSKHDELLFNVKMLMLKF